MTIGGWGNHWLLFPFCQYIYWPCPRAGHGLQAFKVFEFPSARDPGSQGLFGGRSSERALCWKEIPVVISFQKRSTREKGKYRICGSWSSTRQFLIQARAF